MDRLASDIHRVLGHLGERGPLGAERGADPHAGEELGGAGDLNGEVERGARGQVEDLGGFDLELDGEVPLAKRDLFAQLTPERLAASRRVVEAEGEGARPFEGGAAFAAQVALIANRDARRGHLLGGEGACHREDEEAGEAKNERGEARLHGGLLELGGGDRSP